MTTLTQVAEAMQYVLTEVANTAAQVRGFIQRQRKLTGAGFVQMLVFGWMANPDASLEELSQAAATQNLFVTPQAIEQRFTPVAAHFLQSVLEASFEQVIQAAGMDIPFLQRFNGIYLYDSTTVNLPPTLRCVWQGGRSSHGDHAGVKIQVALDYQHGTLAGLGLQAACVHDCHAATLDAPLPAGALRLADIGSFDLPSLRQLDHQRVYWMTRIPAQVKVITEDGQPWNLTTWLEEQKSDRIDQPIRLSAQHQLPCRIVAFRLPEPLAAKRRDQKQRDIRHRQQTVHQSRVELANWTVFATNLPPDQLTFEEIFILARTRWQIELLFKLWKSGGLLDESRSQKPWRILCEVYAKLLMLVVQHWLLLVSCWRYPDRSLTKAAQTIRKQAFHLAAVFFDFTRLCEVLALLQQSLTSGCRINKRRVKPHHYQLLLDPSRELGLT
jgi:hypothetical protein